jgi:LPS-assembly protein
MEFDGVNNALVARQNATFTAKGVVLVADEIRYSKKTQEAVATGNVRLNIKGIRMVAAKATYKSPTGYFTAEDFRLGFFPVMVTGKSLEGTVKEIKLHHSIVYASQSGRIVPNVCSGEMILHPEQESTRVELINSLLRVGPAPVLPVPYLNVNVPKNDDSDIRITLGGDGAYGFYARTSSLYPVSDSLMAGGNLDYYSRRGVMAGPAYNYQSPGGNIQSTLNSGYIYDDNPAVRGVDIRGQPIPAGRGFVDFRYKQDAGPLQITEQTQYWSDSEVLRDFRPNLYSQQQAPESYAEAVLPLTDSYLSVFTRYDPNNFDDVPESMPEVRFDRMATPVGDTGAYWSYFNSVAHIDESPLFYDRYDGILTVERPTALTSWWQFNPVVATRYTYWDNTIAGSPNSSYTRLLGEFGFDSQWSLYKIYDIKNETWGIDGLKHTIQPIIQYRYMPAASAGAGQIPDIEGRVFDTNLRPTDFFYMADVDNLQSMNLMRFGLKQALQTRDDTKGDFPTRDLMTLEFYQDYNFTATQNHPHWDSFYTLAEISPNDWISIGIFTRMSVEDLTWQEDRLYVTLKDGDYRSINFSTRFLQDNDINQYQVTYIQKLTDRLSVVGTLAYDFDLHNFTDVMIALSQRMRDGWTIEYGVQRRVDDTRDSDTGVTVHFHWSSY